MNSVAQVKKLLVGLAAYYDRKLNDDQLAMYAEDLVDLPLDQLAEAIRRYRRNPKNQGFPLPARLRQEIAPLESPEDQARLSEAAIWEAGARFGWSNGGEARDYMGELAWEGVKRSGGWVRVCEAMNEDAGIYRAQMRSLLESIYRAAQAGRLESRPSLPAPVSAATEIAHTALKALPGGE